MRQLFQPRDELLLQLRDTRPIFIPSRADVKRDDARRIESCLDVGQVVVAAKQQRRRSHEQHAQRDLTGDEHFLQEMMASRDTATSSSNHPADLPARGRDGGQKAERAGSDQVGDGGERERAPVDRKLVDSRSALQEHGHQRDQPGCQGGAQQPAGEGDQQPFANDRADHARTGCAKRGTDGHLSRSALDLHQREAGNIRNGDDPERGDRRKDQHQPPARVADPRLLERRDLCGPAGIGLRKFARQRGLHGCQILSRRLERDPGTYPADSTKKSRLADPHQLRRELCWQPDVRAGVGERGGHDADDRIRTSADDQPAANSVAIALETAGPETFADDGRARAVRPFLVIAEETSGKSRHGKHVEEARRDSLAREPLRFLAARISHVLGVAGRQGNEAPGQPLPVLEPRRRNQTGLLTR